MPLPRSVAALRYPNYRRLWLGQLVSVTGSMMSNAAVLWHVTLLVESDERALALAMVGLVRFVPIVVFSLLGGVVADAIDRRRLILVAQAVMTVAAAAMAFLTFRGLASPWPIWLLIGLHASAVAFEGPARQALVPALVPVRDLSNALNLNSILYHGANVLGPPLAGVVMGRLGIGWVYLINAVSFLPALLAVLSIRGVETRPRGVTSGVSTRALREGIEFVFRTPIIRSTMLIDFVATFFSSATALLPLFAQDVLHVGEEGYGLLYAAQFWGALIAGLYLVHGLDRIRAQGRVFLLAVGVYGLATIAFGLSEAFWLTWCCLAVVGGADMVSTVIRNVVRQIATPDGLRGRMTSINMVFFMGGPQLGEVEAGVIARLFGPVVSVVTGGIGCLIGTGWIASRDRELARYARPTHDADGRPIAAAETGTPG